MTRRVPRTTLLALVGLLVSAPLAARAQQTQLDLHGDFNVGTSTHTKAWGGGAGLQVTLGPSSAPVQLSFSPSLDYMKQQNSGPSQTSLSADLSVQPGGSMNLMPYVGVSAGSNWSGGSRKQWQGARLGLETLAGVQLKLASGASLKAEERFGYVKGQEHTLTTRVGVLLGM